MNRIQIHRVEELEKWLGLIINTRGLYVLETSLNETAINEVFSRLTNVTSFRLYRCSFEQPFNECIIQSMSHVLNNDRINSLMDTLILGGTASRITIINQILFRCFCILDTEQKRLLLMNVSGATEDITDEDLIYLDNAVSEQRNAFVVVMSIRNDKINNNKLPFMENTKKLDKVHISYKHLTSHKDKVECMYQSLMAAGIDSSIDQHDIDVRDSIREYEKEIGLSKQVIVIITPEYLKSIQCMFELKEIIKNGDIKKRITVIAELDGIERNADGLRKIKDYWQEEKVRKAEQIKTEPGQIKVLTDELSIINEVITELDDAWLYISQHLTGGIEEMSKDNASKLVSVIKKALSEESVVTNLEPLSNTSSTIGTATTPPAKSIKQGQKSVYIENLNGDIHIN